MLEAEHTPETLIFFKLKFEKFLFLPFPSPELSPLLLQLLPESAAVCSAGH
jgi:hypothetical protein